MPNRNYDSSLAIARVQQRAISQDVYQRMNNGTPIISNIVSGNYNTSLLPVVKEGAQSQVYQSEKGCYVISSGGICNIRRNNYIPVIINSTWVALIRGKLYSQDTPYVAVTYGDDIYIMGTFYDTLYFYNGSPNNPESYAPAQGILIADNSHICTFLAKYNKSGNYVWSTKIGSITNIGDCKGHSLSVDATGIYITGLFTRTITAYDADNPIIPKKAVSSSGETDTFLAKYDLTQGHVQWLIHFGSVFNDSSYSVYANGSAIFITGFYDTQTVIRSVSPGPSIGLSSTAGVISAFIATLSSAGVAQWAAKIENINTVGYTIQSDSVGNIVVAGSFNNMTSIYNAGNINAGILNTPGNTSEFIVKYNAAGSAIWCTKIVASGLGNNVTPRSISISGISDDIYCTGYYNNTATLYSAGIINPAIDTSIISSHILTGGYGGINGYLCKYNNAGQAQWAIKLQSSSTDSYGYCITNDGGSAIYTVGIYIKDITIYSSVPGTTITLTSIDPAQYNMFICKHSISGNLQWATKIENVYFNNNIEYFSVGCSYSSTGGGLLYVTGGFTGNARIYQANGLSGPGLEPIITITETSQEISGFIMQYTSNGAILL